MKSPVREFILSMSTDISSDFGFFRHVIATSVCALLFVFLLFVVFLTSSIRLSNKSIIDGNMKTYYKMDDGTWQVDGHTYQYRLEIKGRMHNAAVDSTFVFLSNIETITFEQAWKAAGYSSNTADYFAVEDAVLVEMN
mgnify:CR=1 FL=1